MTNLADATFQDIKSRLQVIMKAGDADRLLLRYPIPEPDENCHPSVRERWELGRQKYKPLKSFTERYDASIEYFKAAREASTIENSLTLLRSLVLYLEKYTKKPMVDARFITKEDGTLDYWAVATRSPRHDAFFDERVLSVAREVIADLEQARQIEQTLAQPEPSATDEGKAEQENTDQTKESNRAKPSFDTYIKEEHRAKLMPYLIEQYTNQKPRVITAMLYALQKLAVLTSKVDECDQTDLHNALTVTFGNIGLRTSLNSALPLYDGDNIPNAKKQKVEQHRHSIGAFMKP